MNGWKTIFQKGWRFAVCGILMLWIFHSIFMMEQKRAAETAGTAWASLPKFEQWHLAWSHGPAELWRSLGHIKPGAFALGSLVVACTIILGALRWRMALKVHGLKLSVLRTLEISFVAQFFNSFLLGATGGDLIKAYYAARETHHKKTEAVTTVFVDRLIGLWAMLLFAGIMMPFNLDLLKEHETLLLTSALILAMLCGCSLMGILAFWGGVSRRWPNARERLRRLPMGEQIDRSLSSCREYGRNPIFMFSSMAISMILNVVCVLAFIVLSNGMGLNIDPKALFLIVPMIICISALPITPSGLGVREHLFVLLLAVPEINVPPAFALSLSLLAFLATLVWNLAGGLVYAFLRDRHHLDKVASAQGEN